MYLQAFRESQAKKKAAENTVTPEDAPTVRTQSEKDEMAAFLKGQ